MAFLSLKDIGKIYVSEGNVSVGIRGINLDFEKGEFVAVTGKSGSGKSTLLNVISGMDTYEEGELFIEGNPTSHYLQPEWEEYRSEYISFIFQDYNIIESFTVLQNVELALMHIDDEKERRKRALELIDRVGMTSHIKHKGSKLSGGQKQRTVIARALAKDSPIILADEPTGNLDSKTSAEIIELLKEVSKDKLLIVVTHNYEEVEKHATRHIRFYDGAVELDNVIFNPTVSEVFSEKKVEEESVSSSKKWKKEIKKGISLGKAIFISKPKLSLFLCLLMIIGAFSVFSATSTNGNMKVIFEDYYMFNNIEGRLVVTKRSGEVISDDELKKLAEENNAKSFLHYDMMLDETESAFVIPSKKEAYDEYGWYDYEYFLCTYDETFGDDIIGTYPEEENEVFLYLPIYYSQYYGKDSLIEDTIMFEDVLEYKVTGVKYYYDNTKTGKVVFTKDGFKAITSYNYIFYSQNTLIEVDAVDKDTSNKDTWEFYNFQPSFDVEKGKIYIANRNYNNTVGKGNYETKVSFTSTYYEYNYYYENPIKNEINVYKELSEDYISKAKVSNKEGYDVLIHPSLVCELMEEALQKSYKQASLFFDDNKTAHKVAEKLNDMGYLAVPADTTYEPDETTTMLALIGAIMSAISWLLSVVFIAFFVNLCSSRAMSAFKSDMAIMRSMGISVKTIKIGMYVRMFISLIPSFIFVMVGALFIYTSPKFNEYFMFLSFDQYLLLALGLILLTFRVTKKQIKNLFKTSVKKALKGGKSE